GLADHMAEVMLPAAIMPSKTPKNQWYVVEGAKVMRLFCWKRDRQLSGGLHLKLWLGWVNNDWPKTS
ncbi:hypothetical protein ACC728_38400, partial [Rhizobium ruizarguesonis]